MVGICRLCASIKPQKVLTMVVNENELCRRISICCHVEMVKDNFLPKTICPECIRKLNNFYEYYQQVQEAQVGGQESLQTLFPSAEDEVKPNSGRIDDDDDDDISNENGRRTNRNYNFEILSSLATKKTNKGTEFAVSLVEEAEEDVEETKIFLQNISNENPSNQINEDTEENNEETDLLQENLLKKKIEDAISEQCEADFGSREDDDEDAEEGQEDDDEDDGEVEVEGEGEGDGDGEEEEEEGGGGEDGELEYIEILEIQNLKKGKTKISQHNTRDWFDYPWHCFQCPEICDSLNSLLQHCHTIHDLLPSQVFYKCAECQKVWEKYFIFLNHVRFQHRGELLLCCDGCNKHCESEKSLAQHREYECSNLPNDNAFQFYHCPECTRAYLSKSALQLHFKQHKEDTFYKCNECNKFFRRMNNLKVHMDRVHCEQRNYKCDLCDASFGQKINLTAHMVKHSTDKPFQCSVCSKNFKTSSNLQKHALLHTEKKEFKCDFCESYFRTKDAKLSHQRTHTKEKPYQCPYCDRCFSYRSVLKPHINTHTGHRPFKCPYCEKDFTNWSNYNKHTKRIHNITATEIAGKMNRDDECKLDMSFECRYCNKKFYSSGNLAKHSLVHTRKDGFKCSYCESYFRTKLAKSSHERSHTHEKPHQCPCCERCFRYRSVLNKHINIHTNSKNHDLRLNNLHNKTDTDTANNQIERKRNSSDELIGKNNNYSKLKSIYESSDEAMDILENEIPDEFSITIFQNPEGEVSFSERQTRFKVSS